MNNENVMDKVVSEDAPSRIPGRNTLKVTDSNYDRSEFVESGVKVRVIEEGRKTEEPLIPLSYIDPNIPIGNEGLKVGMVVNVAGGTYAVWKKNNKDFKLRPISMLPSADAFDRSEKPSLSLQEKNARRNKAKAARRARKVMRKRG